MKPPCSRQSRTTCSSRLMDRKRRPSGEKVHAVTARLCPSSTYMRVPDLRSYMTTKPSGVPTARRWDAPWKAIIGYVRTSSLIMSVADLASDERTPTCVGSSERTTASARRGRLGYKTSGFWWIMNATSRCVTWLCSTDGACKMSIASVLMNSVLCFSASASVARRARPRRPWPSSCVARQNIRRTRSTVSM